MWLLLLVVRWQGRATQPLGQTAMTRSRYLPQMALTRETYEREGEDCGPLSGVPVFSPLIVRTMTMTAFQIANINSDFKSTSLQWESHEIHFSLAYSGVKSRSPQEM